MHILGGKSNFSGQSWPQFALFLDFYIRLQVSQYTISWIWLSCSEAELIFWVARKFLGWTPLFVYVLNGPFGHSFIEKKLCDHYECFSLLLC